jgi:hypothetical protein
MAALDWLKLHNPLYKDVEINRHVFDGQPDEIFHSMCNISCRHLVSSPDPTPPRNPSPEEVSAAVDRYWLSSMYKCARIL